MTFPGSAMAGYLGRRGKKKGGILPRKVTTGMQVSGRVPGANSSAKLFEDEREGTVFSTDGLEQKREELQHEFHQGVFITQLWFISQADAVRNRRSKGEKRKKKERENKSSW